MRNMRIAERLFNRPLMISEEKLNVIEHVMAKRFNLNLEGLQPMAPQTTAEVISDRERARAGYRMQSGGVAVVGIYGPLLHRRIDAEFPSGGPTTYGEIQSAFDVALKDDAVRHIVLDIDSGGGECNGVFDLADHIFESRSLKPITAVVNESAYSAAYLLASSAHRIIVPRTGGAGSIGVIATHADFSRAEDAAGITVTHLFAGARKADFSPHQPLSDEAINVLQELINDDYKLFVDTVARNRGMKVDLIRETEAGIFAGGKAVKAGLADEVNTVAKAISKAGSQNKFFTRKSANTQTKEKKSMENLTKQELKEQFPDLYTEIVEESREGHMAIADVDSKVETAVTEAKEGFADSGDTIMALHEAVFTEATHTAFADMVTTGVSAEMAKSMGVTVVGDVVPVGKASQILKGLQTTAPAAVGAQKQGDAQDEERTESAGRLAKFANKKMRTA